MEKDRFDFVRVESEQGRDVFVRNPESGEEGLVERCSGETVIFINPQGEECSSDYHKLEEITRSKEEWPRRN
ncbi:MAG TPA: hypothetical protein VJ974_06570 [Geopsychrobacteraceae bacterium]|nr:hypothetical protein [Geopsychrobacteraceae bacterium]